MAGLGHPERHRVLMACALRPQSPKTLAADRERIGFTAYHFRVLAARGLIEVSFQQRVRGSIQTFYVATEKGRELLEGP